MVLSRFHLNFFYFYEDLLRILGDVFFFYDIDNHLFFAIIHCHFFNLVYLFSFFYHIMKLK